MQYVEQKAINMVDKTTVMLQRPEAAVIDS